MHRDPEDFRGMSPGQMLQTLIADMAEERMSEAVRQGVSCSRCMDSGMEGGKFCGCSAGSKLGLQGFKKAP